MHADGEAMLVTGVELRDFRTYARASARLGAGLTVVHGPNGAGKSNLLEAIYFGCTGRSPRTRNDRELVAFGPKRRGSRSRCSRRAASTSSPSLQRARRRRERRQADVVRRSARRAPAGRSGEAADQCLPARAPGAAEGAPTVRRAHLDQVLAALWPARAAVRGSTARSWRNAMPCSRESAQGAPAMRHWRPGTASWRSRTGSDGSQERGGGAPVRAVCAPCRRAGVNGGAALEYRPRSRATDADEFVLELQARLQNDLDRGFSTHGPHETSLRSCATARAAGLRLQGSSAWRCSGCCWPSATCSPRSGAGLR